MSYCRFSSDSFRSDVFVYSGTGGYHILVAQFRCANSFPYPELLPAPEGKRAQERHYKAVAEGRKRWFSTMTRSKIELEHSGETFIVESAQAAIDRLKYLARIGFHVPESALQALADEASDERANEVESERHQVR